MLLCQKQNFTQDIFVIEFMANTTDYNYELCVEICEKVSLGDNIKNVLESNPDKYPTFPTFCRWKREHDELFNLYVNSHQDKAVGIEQEMDLLKDMLLAKEIDPATYNTLVQTLKWKMAKFYSKVFGEKVDLTTNGESLNKPPIFGDNSL